MSARRKPLRWRKAKYPDAGGRWDTPMNRAIWMRDHGDDMEAWQDGKRRAVVSPRNGGWSWHLEDYSKRDWANTREEAMAAATASVKAGNESRGAT